MIWSAEAWLMLLALGLYVYDATLMLQSDELVLERRRGGHWHPVFGANGWKLGRKEPLIANLLAPWRGMVRLRWSFEQGIDGPRTEGGAQLPDVGPVARWGVTLLMVLMFVLFPFCLFILPVTAATLSVIAAIYATCLLVLLSLRRQWPDLGLDNASFWKLFSECLLCPPFCINAVRKASLRAAARVTIADVADEARLRDELDELERQLGRRVAEQIDAEAEDSERMKRLQSVANAFRPQDER